MQDQIYKILSSRSGKPLRQIIKDTKRNDFYLDAQKALEYGLIDAVVAGELPEPKPVAVALPAISGVEGGGPGEGGPLPQEPPPQIEMTPAAADAAPAAREHH